jgi:hypothetical protein
MVYGVYSQHDITEGKFGSMDYDGSCFRRLVARGLDDT